MARERRPISTLRVRSSPSLTCPLIPLLREISNIKGALRDCKYPQTLKDTQSVQDNLPDAGTPLACPPTDRVGGFILWRTCPNPNGSPDYFLMPERRWHVPDPERVGGLITGRAETQTVLKIIALMPERHWQVSP